MDTQIIDIATGFWSKEFSEIARNYVLIGAAAIGLPLAFWRSIVAQKQANTAIRQMTLSERSQNIDRFQKGSGMLADERSSVREAGILVLQSLASQNSNDYFKPVQEVLCSFLREQTQIQWKESDVTGELGFSDFLASGEKITSDCRKAFSALCDIRTAALDADMELESCSLQGVNLTSVSIIEANFLRCNFRGSSLAGAYILDSIFSGASFADANLSGCRINSSEFKASTDLSFPGYRRTGPPIGRAKFDHADLKYSYFFDCNLENAWFPSSQIDGATFEECEFERAMFSEEQVKTARFLRSNISDATLMEPVDDD